MSDITIEDMRDWLKRPETQLFWRYLEESREGWDKSVHSYLRNTGGDEKEALKANVAMDTIVDVMELPEIQIIPDLKERNET